MDHTSSYLYAAPFILLFVGLRMWRGSRARRLRIERMWIRPVIFLLVLTLLLWGQPPPMTAPVIAALALAGAAGLLFGWWRARMVKITINVENHELSSQQSVWGLLILVGLMLARMGVRAALGGQDAVAGIPVVVIVDGLTIFYGANVIGGQVEMWLRARKLLADTIAAKAAGKATPAEVSEDHA